mgnify:CR=1 FL=1
MPRLQKWALNKYLISSFERKQMFVRKQGQYNEWLLSQEKGNEATLEKIVEVKEKQVKQKEAIEKTRTKEEKWEEEFENIRHHAVFSDFSQLTTAVYKHGGMVKAWNGNIWLTTVQPDVLAFADSIGLIAITGKSVEEQHISFTEKGKFFVSKYIEKPGI